MKFKVLSSLFALALVAGVGCGDDTGTGGAGGTPSDGGGGTGSGGDPSTGGNPVTTGGGGEGGTNMGDGNDTLETATPLEDNQGIQEGAGDLDPPDSDLDYYSFQGLAGFAVHIQLDAVPNDDTAELGNVDTFITLYNAAGEQIARNDDPFPRFSTDSELVTILPSDGEYFVRVEEWCASVTADPESCDKAYFDDLSDLSYTISIIHYDPAANSIVPEAAEPNETGTTIMEYEPVEGSAGDYYFSLAYGAWQTQDDALDGIRFTVPADLALDPGTRAQAYFVFPPGGINGNGSATTEGVVQIIEVASGDIVASFDYTNESLEIFDREELTVPVEPGGEYVITLGQGGALDGTLGPFYTSWHLLLSGNPVETQEATNGVQLTPEVLSASDADSYFVEGNIGFSDTDFFRVAPLGGVNTLTVACGGASSGSGTTLTVAVLAADDGEELATMTETAAPDGTLLIEDIDTTGEANVLVRVTGTQDGAVDGNWYKCGFHFVAPAEQ